VNRDNALRERRSAVKVWDAPTRLFHWAIVVLVFASWLTAHQGWMDWHVWSGYSILLVLLTLLALQVATGLCANDQVLTQGPFADAVGQDTSDWLSHIHVLNFKAIEALVALHVAAVLTYAAVKRHNLIGPMITGNKRLPATLLPPRLASPLLAAAILAAAAGIVAFIGFWWAPT
jgi:cytochrome b